MAHTPKRRRLRLPALWIQIVIAVVLGGLLGELTGQEPFVGNFGTEELGRLGMLVIRALKTLAVPLVLFTILDAILRYPFGGRRVARLVAVCLVNVTVALSIGLAFVHLFAPGARLAPHFQRAMAAAPGGAPPAHPQAIDPLASLEALIPKTVIEPIDQGSIIGTVVLAILFGAALRRVQRSTDPDLQRGYSVIENIVRTLSETLIVALGWVVLVVPYACFGLVAQAVGRSGLGVFADLWVFLVVIVGAMAVHVLVWYPLVVWFVGRRTPRAYLGGATDAIVTGIATNSSLATVPVTLRCLDELKVAPESARLAACAATNLNNDGITLYEVMAALIIVQACGMDVGIGGQIAIAAAAVFAAAGIAGIPEAGLVVLPIVLAAAGLPDHLIALAVPLVVPVDWILARCRTIVNVLSDMLVAIVVDGRAAERR